MLVLVVSVDDHQVTQEDRLARGALTGAQRLILQRLAGVVGVHGHEQARRLVPQVERDGVAMQQLTRVFGYQLDELAGIQAGTSSRGQVAEGPQRAPS